MIVRITNASTRIPNQYDRTFSDTYLGSSERHFLIVVLVLEIHFRLGNLVVPVLDSLGDLFLGRNLFPQVHLRKLGVRCISLLLLGSQVSFSCCNLFFVRLG